MRKFAVRSLVLRSLAVLVGLFFTAAIASAQSTTGNLQGKVVDQNGAVVTGASVKVTNTETGVVKETTTNDEGFYRVTNLIPGEKYKVEVSGGGLSSTTENVIVRLATENTWDIVATATGGTNTVTITTQEQALINTTQSQLSQSYTPQQLTQLPFNGGSIDNLALLTPGVATPGDADFTNGVGISSNGNRGRSNNFQIDGQDNNDNSVAGPSLTLTNTEAIGEYQVITNNFSAEFGRNAGAQINVITKPGTNDFHGSLFEYLQNSALDTRDNLEKQNEKTFRFLGTAPGTLGPFFTNLANSHKGKDPYTYNRFGGSIGGPLKKNKAFFFVTYQGDRQRGTFTSNNFGGDTMILTPESVNAIRNSGNFPIGTAILTNSNVGGYPTSVTGHGQLIIVPPTLDTNGDGVPDVFLYGAGNPFGNPVQANLLAPVAYIRSGGPASPIIPLFGGEGIRFTGNNYTEDQLITREDINLTSKDVLGIRYIYDRTFFPDTPATGTTLTGAFFDVPSKNNNLGITYTRTLSSRLINEARFNFSRLNVEFGDPNAAQPGTANPGPGISFSGTRTLFFDLFRNFGTANNLPQSRRVDVYQEQDTLTATWGNHALKFGGDLRQQKVDNFFLPNFLGVYTFNGGNPFLGFSPTNATALTAGPVPPNTFFFDPGNGSLDRGAVGVCSATQPCRATAVENLLLGRFRQVNFARGNPRIKTTQNDFFFFVQDDWRIRPNFTLNLGLRYELSTQPFNPIIDAVNAREADASTALFDPTFPLSSRTTANIPTDKNNVAPRFGFAWTPKMSHLGNFFDNHQTVIRGGFGIAYDPSYFNIVLNTVTAAPFAVAGVLRQNPGSAGSLTYPFLPSTIAQQNLTPGTNGGDPRLFNQTRVDPGFYNPYTMQYNFGVQQELWGHTVLEARYVGSRIVGQFQTVNGNPNVQFLNRAAQCLGLNPGAFSNGIVVGTAAASAAAACAGSGFDNRPGTNGNGRIDPNFGAVRTRINGASSTYNGLQMRLDTRFSNSFVMNVNYTLSKTIDNASEIFSTGGGGQGVADPQRFFDATNGERGLSAFHQKHIFSMNAIYDVPWFKEQKGVVGHVLGGYRLSGILRAGSGRPYQPLEAFGTYDPAMENAFFGVGALRAFNGNPTAANGTIAFGYQAACSILFGGPYCDYNGGALDPGEFVIFNTLSPGSTGTVATAAQALQQARLVYNDFGLANQFGLPLNSLEGFMLFKTPFGDVGRNSFSGLPFYLLNMAVYKTTKITEGTSLEFRVEANNLLNRRNFGVPDAFTEDAASGFTVSSFQNPGFNNGSQRSLRFGLRFLF